MKKGPTRLDNAAATSAAACRLLETYRGLAVRGEHLMGRLLRGQAPKQWTHYPETDAIDQTGGYQWFYHSHSPEDRPSSFEHGHIHLFARKPLWSRRLRSRAERAFAEQCGNPTDDHDTRHLLAIGFDAKGLPVSLFTVNSCVTGDLMLGADLTLELLKSMKLDTGQAGIDAVIESLIRLCEPELRELMRQRDDVLSEHLASGTRHDQSLEILSEVRIDLDQKIEAVSYPASVRKLP